MNLQALAAELRGEAYAGMTDGEAAAALNTTAPVRVRVPNTATAVIVWHDWTVLSDKDLSMMGEARHKTVGGRGVVGRLVDNSQRHGT